MRTPHPTHKTTIRYTWNRRIAMLLACILLFHAVFAGVEVHAQDTSDPSQTSPQTATPIPADSYTIDFDKTGAWDGYAQYSVTITNTTTGPLENTALAAQWQDVEIDAIWGANAQKTGNTIYILPLEWSTTIDSESPLVFGIIIKGNNQDLNPPEHIALFPIEDIKKVLIGQMLLPPWEQAEPTPAPSSQPGPDPVITGEPSPEPNPAPTETPAPTCTTEVEQTSKPEPTIGPIPTPEPTQAPTPTPTAESTAEPTASPAPIASPTPTATPTPVPTVAPTPEPTPSPKPTTPPHLTLEIAGTQSATYGYTNPPQTSIRITNTGQGISAPFTLELAAGGDSPFTLTPPVKNVLAGAEQTILTLTLANGLDAGLYTDTLTLHTPGQEDQTIPVLQQVNKLPVLEPAIIRIASITTDTITLSEIPGYQYAIAQQPDQPSPYQDSPVFAGLQPDTNYTLLMRKKETKNHTAGQITTAQVHTSAIPAPEPTPVPEPTSAPEPTGNPDATATPEPVGDLHVNGSLTLTQNTICRNLYMNGTSLDLNGYSLAVQENVQHTSGTIYAEKAGNTLTVQENYIQDGGELHIDGANVTIGGSYEQNANSNLFMCGSKKDTLTIQGSWLVNTTSQNRYNYGTIRLHGNLTRTKNACKNQIQQDNDTRIYLQGTAPQTIDLGTSHSGTLGILYLGNTTGITFTQPLHAQKIHGLSNIANPDSITLHIEELELTQDETIICDVTLSDGYYDLNGHALTITGNLTQNGGTIQAGNTGSTLTITQNYTQDGGALRLENGSTLQVNGTYTGNDGDLYTNGGSAAINQNYEQNALHRLYMAGNRKDTLTIHGDWIINNTSKNVHNYGTILLHGDLIQTGQSNPENLQMDEDTILRFVGDDQQLIQLAHPETANLGKLHFDNPAGVYTDSALRAVTIHGMPVSDTWETLDLEADTLKLTGDSTCKGNIIINADVDLDGHNWTIDGNLKQTGGTIYIGNGNLHVKGDYTAKSGELNAGEGKTTINGSYYLIGNAALIMQKTDASVTVDSNLRIRTTTSEYGYLTAGTLTVRGNLKQLEGASENSFVQEETFTLELAGTGTQHISLLYPDESIFNNLQITSSGGVKFQSAISFRQLHGWENIKNERLTISSLYSTLQESITYPGSITLLGGSIDLNGKTLDIGGNLMQADTAMHVNKGLLRIRGDYELAGQSSLHMINPEDYVTVYGTFQTRSDLSHQSILRDGILTIRENLWQKGNPASFRATENHMVYFSGESCFAGFDYPDSSGFAHVTGNYQSDASFTFKAAINTYSFCIGAVDGIHNVYDEVVKFLDDPNKVLSDGENAVLICQTLVALFSKGEVAYATSVILLFEMAYMIWNSPEMIEYSDDKKEVAYQLGYIVGGMLLVAAIMHGAKNVINSLTNQVSVNSMLNTGKLQCQGILTKSDALSLAAGDSGGILVGVGEVFGAEGAATVEGAGLTAVEEGIVLKTGRILSYSFPGLNMNKDVADKVCDEVKDGAEEPEEIAKSIGEEATKWSSENLDVEKMFTEDAIGHLDEVKGYTKKGGIQGAHTIESFERATKEVRPVEILSKEKRCDGIYDIKYQVAKMYKGKPVIKPDGTYELRADIYTKTVIDTAEMSIDDVVSMAKETFASGEIAFTEKGQKCIIGISKDGIKFLGWIDSQTDTLTSFYPVKEWPEKLLKGVE